MADRKAQEATYKQLAKGRVSDGRWSDTKLAEEIEKLREESKSPEEKMDEGLKAQNSTEPTPNRYAEPQSQERFQPVDDQPAEFKKDPEQDKITQKVKSKEKLFPVKLLKNYRPISEEAQIQGTDGVYRPLSEEEAQKGEAGSHVSLPVDEAQSVIRNKIAERNDPIA